jgi:hypothetical protein
VGFLVLRLEVFSELLALWVVDMCALLQSSVGQSTWSFARGRLVESLAWKPGWPHTPNLLLALLLVVLALGLVSRVLLDRHC